MAVADVDGDACNDVVAAGTYGTGMVHLGDGALGFDGGRDLPQLGYQNPATATRVTMAVGDLSGDGRPEVVIADKGNAAVMIYRNTSSPAGAPCFNASPTAKNDVATVSENAPLTTIDVLANDTDPDGGPKLVASVTPPAHGTAAIGGGGVRYKPNPGYCNDLGPARDTFTYKLNGGSSATVAVTVQCVDDSPPPGPARASASAAAPASTAAPAAPRTCITPGTTQFTVGTPGDDVLVGSNGRDVLSGRGGDDCLFGRANDDRLTGGTGDDLLDGGSGGDRINGDAGKDKIRAGRGNDDITPGAGQGHGHGPGRQRRDLRPRLDPRRDRLRRRRRQGEGRPQRLRQELRVREATGAARAPPLTLSGRAWPAARRGAAAARRCRAAPRRGGRARRA